MIGEIRQSQQKEMLVQRLGVFELRALAREVGVPSPTTKKRDELISLILDSFKTGVSKEPSTQKRGRPYKKLTSLEGIVNSVVEEEEKGEIKYDTIIRFAQEEKPFVSSLGDITRIEGVASKTEKGIVLYSLNSSEKVFIDDIGGAERICSGDLVEVNAQKINDEQDYNAVSLSLINGQCASIYQPNQYNHGEEVISTSEIPTSQHKIIEGRRNACLIEEDLYEGESFKEILDFCNITKTTLVLLGTNTSYENQIFFKKKGVRFNFSTAYGSRPAVNLRNTINGLNFAENCFNNGESVVVVVTDMGGLLNGLDENFEVEANSHAKETQVIAKKMISLAGAYESGVNFTLIMFYSDLDKNDQFLQSDILRVCKRS